MDEVTLSPGTSINVQPCISEPSVKRQRLMFAGGQNPSIEPSIIVHVIPGGANFRALSFYLKVIELRYFHTRNEQLDILQTCHM